MKAQQACDTNELVLTPNWTSSGLLLASKTQNVVVLVASAVGNGFTELHPEEDFIVLGSPSVQLATSSTSLTSTCKSRDHNLSQFLAFADTKLHLVESRIQHTVQPEMEANVSLCFVAPDDG